MNTRREFVTRTCSAGALAALASILEGCGKNSDSPTAPSNVSTLTTVGGTKSGSTVTVNIGAGSPLASVGGAALVQAGGSQILVAQTSQNTFAAVTAICTHEACTITGFGSSTYVCPCHGSTYDINGKRLSGPAPSSLKQFATSFANGVLTINT